MHGTPALAQRRAVDAVPRHKGGQHTVCRVLPGRLWNTQEVLFREEIFNLSLGLKTTCEEVDLEAHDGQTAARRGWGVNG
jgi:hypothetical protein